MEWRKPLLRFEQSIGSLVGEALSDLSFTSVSSVDDCKDDLSLPLRHHHFLHFMSMRHHPFQIQPSISLAQCTSVRVSQAAIKHGFVHSPVASFTQFILNLCLTWQQQPLFDVWSGSQLGRGYQEESFWIMLRHSKQPESWLRPFSTTRRSSNTCRAVGSIGHSILRRPHGGVDSLREWSHLLKRCLRKMVGQANQLSSPHLPEFRRHQRALDTFSSFGGTQNTKFAW